MNLTAVNIEACVLEAVSVGEAEGYGYSSRVGEKGIGLKYGR